MPDKHYSYNCALFDIKYEKLVYKNMSEPQEIELKLNPLPNDYRNISICKLIITVIKENKLM